MNDNKLINKLPEDMIVMLQQPYALTMAKHKLNVHEMRVMMHIMRALQPKMSMEMPYEIGKTNLGDTTIKIAVRDLLPVGSQNYRHVREALNGLTKKHINMKFYDEKGLAREVFTHLVMEAVCEYRDEFAQVQISRNLIPQIITLSKGYTKYLLNVAFNSSSAHAIKLYYFISHFKDRPQISITVKLVRELLGIENKYKKPKDIKRRIFNPAINELKHRADVWFDIAEVIKEGRRVWGWKFNIHNKAKKRKKKTTSLPSYNELEEKLVSKFGLSYRQAQKVASKAPRKELNKALYEILLLISDKKITNIGGYTAKVLSEKFNLKL